jgi:hypothetical protein
MGFYYGSDTGVFIAVFFLKKTLARTALGSWKGPWTVEEHIVLMHGMHRPQRRGGIR